MLYITKAVHNITISDADFEISAGDISRQTSTEREKEKAIEYLKASSQ